MKRRVKLVCIMLVGCTYGGSDEDPLMGLEPGSTGDDSVMSDAVMGGSDDAISAPSTKPPMSDGGMNSGTTNSGATSGTKTPTTGGGDASVSTGNASTVPNACGPAKPVATCDPVRNTGCPPLTQCDIETSATTPTGRCVFFQATPGVPCSSSFVNVTCDAQNTCVAGECRKMCYCDSDCPPDNCCSDTSGPGPAGAFKLCHPC
jgi:hypothetical protein